MTIDLLNRIETAKYLKITPISLDHWIYEHKFEIPYHRIGNRRYYKKADIDAWIESRRIEPVAQ